jgi:hypothetical protein
MDVNAAEGECFKYYMGLNMQKTTAVSFIHKKNSIYFNYYICDVSIFGTNCAKIRMLHWTVNCTFVNVLITHCVNKRCGQTLGTGYT